MIETLLGFILDWKTLTGFGALLLGGGGLAAWLLPGVLPFFLGSKLGRQIVLIGAAVFALLIFLARIMAIGAAKERLKQQQAREAAKRERIRTDEEIRTLPADKRRERMDKWVRD